MTTPVTGILPVVPTPFFDDGTLDDTGMTRVLDCTIDQGVDAICILANYSEQFVLSDDERQQMMRTSLEHVAGRVPMIVTISHYSTAIARDRAVMAQSMGADMVMMMPPYHGAGLKADDNGIMEHYRAVSDAISIPIMVQDAPISGVNMSVDLLAKMAKTIENVSYFKMEMPFAADKLAKLIELGGSDILGPWDGEEAATLYADLEAGCTASMTSALQCEHIRPIVTHFLNGDKDAAMEQWKYCLPLINHENRQCGLRATKTVMKEGGVIQSDHVRHPQKPMSERTKATLLQLAKEMDLISLKWGK